MVVVDHSYYAEPSFDEESDPEYTLARSRHCDLMNSILDDQDRIISRHKDTIDRTIAITKEEMYILQREENSEESNLELYVNDSLLAVRKKLQVSLFELLFLFFFPPPPLHS